MPIRMGISHCSSSSCHCGDLRGMGLRPLPRIPNSPSFTFLPTPLQSCPLQSLGRGVRGKDGPALRCIQRGGVRDSRLLPLTPKNSNDNDGKGAMVSRTMRPYFLLYLCMQSCMQQAERQSLEGIAEEKDKTKTTRQNQRAKAKRGFWGVGARLAYPHSTLPLSHNRKTLRSSERVSGIEWYQ